jgi:HKD family nuclease
MFRYQLIAQSPSRKSSIAEAVQDLAGEAEFDRLRGFFAFATEPGVAELLEYLTKGWRGDWEKTLKRWLISADFGFTEPKALRAFSSLRNSEVRIPDASYLLDHRLNPRTTHHAKALILDRRAKGGTGTPLALLVGSANLTLSALRGNFEAATAASWSEPLRKADRISLDPARQQVKEFERVWRGAEKLDATMLSRYETVRGKVRKSRPWPEQERRPLVNAAKKENAGSFELAAALRSAERFWIQTGNMYDNLRKKAGNQVDMKAGSRVFFGFSNRTVAPGILGEIELGYRGRSPSLRHVHYGTNSMDKIYLPNPGTEGTPDNYENEVLLFERKRDGTFRFKVGTPAEAEAWKRKSESQGTAFKMQSGGREFGVFS